MSQELAERYNRLYTGAIVDVLDELGWKNQVLPHNILPLEPGTRLAGPAFTVLGKANRNESYDDSIRRILQMLGEATPGSVVVYESNDSDSAHLGELSVVALKARGCRGAVVDGGVRDVAMILSEKFPVFCRYTTPKDGPPRWLCVDWNVPIVIGDVRIQPGDFIVGDHDGIVVVPREIVLEVLERAEKVASEENSIREAVRQGESPLAAYEKFGRF